MNEFIEPNKNLIYRLVEFHCLISRYVQVDSRISIEQRLSFFAPRVIFSNVFFQKVKYKLIQYYQTCISMHYQENVDQVWEYRLSHVSYFVHTYVAGNILSKGPTRVSLTVLEF